MSWGVLWNKLTNPFPYDVCGSSVSVFWTASGCTIREITEGRTNSSSLAEPSDEILFLSALIVLQAFFAAFLYFPLSSMSASLNCSFNSASLPNGYSLSLEIENSDEGHISTRGA